MLFYSFDLLILIFFYFHEFELMILFYLFFHFFHLELFFCFLLLDEILFLFFFHNIICGFISIIIINYIIFIMFIYSYCILIVLGIYYMRVTSYWFNNTHLNFFLFDNYFTKYKFTHFLFNFKFYLIIKWIDIWYRVMN